MPNICIFMQGGNLYLDFVSGILLSITQLSGFVSTGLSLRGQLYIKNKKKKSLGIEVEHNRQRKL